MSNQKIKSIYSQLAFFYSLGVVTLLVLIAFAFYWETQNVLNQADYNFVTEEANSIQSIMRDAVLDKQLLKKAVVDHPLRTRNSLYRYYVRILDATGKVVMETPGLSEIFSPTMKPLTDEGNQEQFIWKKHHGDDYLNYSAPIKLNNGKTEGRVQIALDTSYQHAITHDRRIFVILLVLGMLLSLLLGKFVTSRGLKSLDVLTETVKNITTSSLNQRVDPQLLPIELADLAKSFNQMLDRIETSFARMHQMSADMSHELRTPITNLIGQTEILLSYDHSEEDYRNAQASNLEELQRMASLVENILFLARAESQQPQLEKQTIDAAFEIAKVCDYYQALADDKNIHIIQSGKASLAVNTIMFRRLLSNLISNAIKYSKDDTTIAVAVIEKDESVVLSVSDSGVGIAPENIPKLFDRFYRVDDARSADISGTGLGLSIVKSIVDLHHGNIAIQSTLGIGTVIQITLPK
jgi:two-component system heavy metal sensor histidine kinase CusS